MCKEIYKEMCKKVCKKIGKKIGEKRGEDKRELVIYRIRSPRQNVEDGVKQPKGRKRSYV
jgi:hypothetical protein